MTLDIHGPCTTALKALETRRKRPMRKRTAKGALRHVD
jgi:hypothetical protein